MANHKDGLVLRSHAAAEPPRTFLCSVLRVPAREEEYTALYAFKTALFVTIASLDLIPETICIKENATA